MSLKFRFKALSAIRWSHISRQVIPLEQAPQTCYIFRRYRSHRPSDSLCATKCYDNGHPGGETLRPDRPSETQTATALSAGEKQSLTKGEDQEKIRKMLIAPKLCGVTKNEPHLQAETGSK